MGRSIPSFRMLIDIQRLEWTNFRKELGKKDKQIFSKLFLIPKLYGHASSSLSNSITIEPIILSILFNNSKSINQIRKDLLHRCTKFEYDIIEEKIFQDSTATTIQSDIILNAQYNNTIYELKRFSEALSIEDEIIFLNIISNCYRGYKNSLHSDINNKISRFNSFRNMPLFMAIILYQQKHIDLINKFLTRHNIRNCNSIVE
ncbi:hypothetical protein [Candidatus Nitrosocosmicus franklandus]|uniref:DUF8156 domain-containing protein n=1 Tax=Candidatus Nitrosocosmicus franklandianus TaxID=1798806 RepID=A0A484ID35_9ARCH|nr:hypothetical protein [Candidatus Nitrosocosmicus franklandus]VFJ13957.1 conserved protein of unknown function [Candidatus Nitrosocosmicus franklandus]